MLKDTKKAHLGLNPLEYSQPEYFFTNSPFPLENGNELPELRIAYHTFGRVNEDRSNVVWVFHALTANANPLEWWPGLIGEDDLINPKDHFIVCANIIGSCYGSTGPKDFDIRNGERYLRDFPNLTIRDIVNAHQLLQAHLGIDEIWLGIGGSMGGQQALEWSIQDKRLFKHLALVATSAKSSPWGIAIRAAQRMAIESDPSFYSSSPKGGWKGLEAARAMAMISYRNHETFNSSQQDPEGQLDNFSAESYQRYQGEKLGRRFDARTYYTLNKAMDTHDVGRGRRGIENALSQVKAKVQVIGITGDLLFTEAEQQQLHSAIPDARLNFVPSKYGHDGFLVEAKGISNILQNFLNVHQ
ncbi:homoserine O-acetyltransferase [Roseivirga sp. E12]|uniref:homoserine O-acetyltransferase family protein n=1 Tax=Roseivirga sp. E12 TaxID=2819237 RepID=UPI001ABC1527|nr:homoserine O-acetyltransferase [Roseivirga sp. E12]MBO3699474.1 homoserine O-acetyltransferase [Roseivirga sp. E12]